MRWRCNDCRSARMLHCSDPVHCGEMTMSYANILEELAALEHDRWSRWMRYLLTKGQKNPDGSFTIAPGSVAHWERQQALMYCDLSEREKESDRQEARRTLQRLHHCTKNPDALSLALEHKCARGEESASIS